MPVVSSRLIRASLVWLIAGAATALVPTAGPALGWPAAALLRPTAWHLLAVGWLTQLAFGVAWWLLPRPRGPASDAPAVHALVTLNAGLLLRCLAEPARALALPGPWGAMLSVAAVLHAWAATAFVVGAWPRTRPREV